jgi:hypothetical protein
LAQGQNKCRSNLHFGYHYIWNFILFQNGDYTRVCSIDDLSIAGRAPPAEAGIQKKIYWMPHQVWHDMPTKSKEVLDALHWVDKVKPPSSQKAGIGVYYFYAQIPGIGFPQYLHFPSFKLISPTIYPVR